MGLFSFLLVNEAIDAASKAVKKVNEQMGERNQTNKEIALEQEKTKRLSIEMSAEERRREEIHAIKMARIQNPINVVCPRCSGNREFDRIKGIITCPYCDFIEPLSSVHCFHEEIDGPSQQTEKKADEVKNSSWQLTGWTIGAPQPKNQSEPVWHEVPSVEQNGVAVNRTAQVVQNGTAYVDKSAYCILAFFLGGFGAHKFYAKQNHSGKMYLLFCWTGIPLILGIFDCIIGLCKQAQPDGKITMKTN